MHPLIRRSALLIFASFFVASAQANPATDAQKDLENFIANQKTLRADFVQVSTKPNGQRARPISGRIEFSRPGQFRFHYKQPFEQVIASDGQTLWVHDVDLNQVSTRKLSSIAAYAPALLVASASDFASLRRRFDFSPMPAPAGNPADVRWVRAAPKQSTAGDAADESASLGTPAARVDMAFRGEVGRGSLSELILIDTSGQRTVMRSENVETGVRFAPQHFQFKPPAGAEVMKQ